MTASYRRLGEVIPIMGLADGCVISRRGDVTVGWEMTLPVAFSMTEEGYDEIVSSFASAARLLPPWTMIHRQDVFLYERYRGEYGRGYLSDSFNRHFEGRRYLTHRQYLFLTMSGKASATRKIASTAAFGIRYNAPVPDPEDIRQFGVKAEEFITVVTGGGRVKARRLTEEDLEGRGTRAGLIDRYLMLGEEGPLRSDIETLPGEVRVSDKVMLGFKIAEAEELPGEVSDVIRVEELSTGASSLYLSYASALGIRLDCEHFVNQYILMPSQTQVLQDLDAKRKRMVSMSSSAENRVNAGQIQEFIDAVHRDSLTACLSHVNVLVWGPGSESLELKGKVSSALSSMGIVATRSLYDLPTLYWAGCPGGACEISVENLMTQELGGMLCMGINETFDRPVPGGTLKVVDRLRNVPIAIDIQRSARDQGLIDNYNVFLLGPSGTGKSFFTNYFLRQCYDNGEHLFGIDVGDSYQGLAAVIREESRGRDGVYMSWDDEHPFSFNPFVGWSGWVDRTGALRQDDSGVTFFLALLKALWRPRGGWTTELLSILETIVIDFVVSMRTAGLDRLPVFDDFYRFLGEEIKPRIMPVYDDRGEVKSMPKDPYVVAFTPVTPDDFDIASFLRALKAYSAEGGYSFLLNERDPRDLFASRFTVFEVSALSQSDRDPLFYSVCVLCIMNAFDHKMRGSGGFKRIFIDEAWKAIANETMAPYLREIWKVSRKYQCGAMVITQELDDILSSEVIREAILQNSDTKILLNQQKNMNRFGQLSSLMGLSDHQRDLILSMELAHNPDYYYKDCYIGMNGRYGVYSIEASPEEAMAFESDKVRKRPMLELAAELGSIRKAIDELVGSSSGRRK